MDLPMRGDQASGAPLRARSASRTVFLFAGLLLITTLAMLGTHLMHRYWGVHVTSENQAQSLLIVSWNIGKLYLKWESRAVDSDLEHVAEVLREINPHIVALQELKGPEQLGRLATLMGPQWRAKVPEDSYDRRAGLVVRVPVRFVDLPTSSGRVAQGAEITLDGGHRFAVASLHLDAFDERRRLNQAEEIVAGIRRLDTDNIVLAGDFNFDVSVAAQGSIDQRLYAFLTREMVDASKRAGATTVVSRRLDYVFFRSPLVRSQTARVLRDKRINIMDHDPLLVELALIRGSR